MNRIIFGITTGILVFAGLILFKYYSDEANADLSISPDVEIEETWELPDSLEEVSGIAYLKKNRIACVQDEEGILYLFNLSTSQIEQEIEFGESGDYEGLAVWDSSAFVLKSDGSIFMVEDFLSKPKVKEFETPLRKKQDVEGLCLDKSNNSLLLAIKEKEPETDDYKGVYEFNLEKMEMEKEARFRIDFRNEVFKEVQKKKLHKTFKPSEINIDPSTGEFVMLDGVNSTLLILDPNGNPKEFHQLDSDDFPQPEGLTFDSRGRMYISNEGKPATIHRVIVK